MDFQQFSWFGWAYVLKMTVLPRLLYFNVLPIQIPNSFFKKLSGLQRKFLWADKKPRINLCLLTLPKSKEGIGLPDFSKYNFATQLFLD